jgi:hypothetical protein
VEVTVAQHNDVLLLKLERSEHRLKRFSEPQKAYSIWDAVQQITNLKIIPSTITLFNAC